MRSLGGLSMNDKQKLNPVNVVLCNIVHRT